MRKKMLQLMMLTGVLGLGAFALVGCEDDGAEDVADDIGDAVDDAADAVDDAIDDIGD